MKHSKKENKLDRQAEQHIIIGKLLKKERSEEKRRSIENILNSNYPLNDKIQKIQKVDEPKKTMHDRNQPLFKDVQVIRNRKEIKLPIAANTFFKFLFGHYIKIKEFGIKTHVIDSGFIPFTFKINRTIKVYFKEYHQKEYAPKLIKLLNYVMEYGWEYLTKKEYNRISILKKFCECIMDINFDLLDFKDSHLIDRLHILENYFLMLHYDYGYIEAIIESIKKALENSDKYLKEIKDIGVYIRRLTDPELTLPSIYNFILGLNMLKYKKYLELVNLINKNCGSIISYTYFDCDSVTQEKINDFIKDTEFNMRPIIARRDELRRLKAFLPKEAQNNYEMIESFYNDKNAKPPFNFNKDKNNLIHFTINYCTRFLMVFKNFLNGRIQLEGNQDVEIFSGSFFSAELSRLHFLTEKLIKSSFSISNLSYDRFIILTETTARNALTTEVDAFQIISDIGSLFIDVGSTLSKIITLRQPQRSLEIINNAHLAPVILTGRMFSVPYENSNIVSEDLLHGRSVIDSLSYICCLCMITGVFYRNRTMTDLLKSEEKIEKALKTKIELVQRISDTETFQRIRRTNHF